MKFNAILVTLLMLLVIAAPVVDATVCEDCNDFMRLPDSARLVMQDDHAAAVLLIQGKDDSITQNTKAGQELCPFCSQSVAPINLAACNVPTTIGQLNHLPQILTLSDLSTSIIKPPQN